MRSLIIGFGILILSFSEMNSAVAEMCKSYVGQTIEPTSYEAVEKLLSKVPSEKGEFETTADFEKKVSAIRSTWPKSFLIAYSFGEIGKESLKYDADNQHIIIYESIFNSSDRYAALLFGLNFNSLSSMRLHSYKRINYGIFNLKLMVSSTASITGGYDASNSQGATVTVVKQNRITKRIFERKIEYNESMFVNQKNTSSRIGVLPLLIKDAKAFKKSGRAAVLIVPKEPYLAVGERTRNPTFSSPLEIHEKISVIIADIQCTFLLDGNNTVLGAYTVN